jgi:hypothetical protein
MVLLHSPVAHSVSWHVGSAYIGLSCMPSWLGLALRIQLSSSCRTAVKRWGQDKVCGWELRRAGVCGSILTIWILQKMLVLHVPWQHKFNLSCFSTCLRLDGLCPGVQPCCSACLLLTIKALVHRLGPCVSPGGPFLPSRLDAKGAVQHICNTVLCTFQECSWVLHCCCLLLPAV